jgi:hypothetical protein
MATSQGANEVTLSVEFAGICLYVIDRRDAKMTVVRILMPTCVPNDQVSAKHEDGDTGARHVPYLLMDLANLDQRVPPGTVADGPQFEVVRRLRGEEILFELNEPHGSVTLDPDPLPLPDLSIYKRIALKPGLIDDNKPPAELNVRAILRGGTLTATTFVGSGKRNVPDRKRRDWDKFEADWAGSIKWTRKIPAGSLNIGIRSWETGQNTPLTLAPVKRNGGEVIELKIADLCETNPLEWREFEPRFRKDDVDFKWLFRLFDAPDSKDDGSLLRAIGRDKFPYPHLRPRGARPAGYTGCTGGQFGLP